MATTLRRKRNKSSAVCEYKPPLYPSFTVNSVDGVKLTLDEKNMEKVYTAKVKLTGINKKTTSKKQEIDWTFEIQSIES